MLSKLFIFFIFLGILAYIFLFSKASKVKKDFNPDISYKLVQAGALLIDVRTKEEYEQGFAKGAINISHTEIEKNEATFSPALQHGYDYTVLGPELSPGIR